VTRAGLTLTTTAMASRRYFTKVIPPPIDPPKIPPPRLVVGSKVDVVTGKRQHRLMSGVNAAQLLGASKGGQLSHAKGTGHRWTPAQARRAARKYWKMHPVTRTGRRLGVASKRRPKVARAPLRELYAFKPLRGIWYDPQLGWRRRVDNIAYGVSERTALTALGYITPRIRTKQFLPEDVQAVPLPGTAHAVPATESEDSQ
jgi:hypothetical protein